MMNTGNLTVGFDVTTQEGIHMNSIHVTTEDRCFVLAIDQLAGGTAEDYADHICFAVEEIARAYSDIHSASFQDCRSAMIANVANTMSDRVAVNHAAICKVEERWGKCLNELHCHLHPLDTIASSCRAALKKVEVEKGALYGTDCVAGNLVLQISKFRYKDSKGDPKGFCLFLDKNNLPRGLIPRYRGNRFHIIFHTSGILITHHEKFLHFFTTGVVSCGGLQTCIRRDFASTTGQLGLQTLGLFGKLLTGPWMTKFYRSAEQQIDHIDGIEVVRGVIEAMKQARHDPLRLLTQESDFFSDLLDDADPVMKAVRIQPPDQQASDTLSSMLTACIDATITVLERQYGRYFAMDLTEKLRQETQSARSHNMDAEEIIGMFSAGKNRAPSVTLDFLASKICGQKNMTVEYLDGLPVEDMDSIVTQSISKARKKRVLLRKRQTALQSEMSKRVTIKLQEKKEKSSRALEKQLANISLDEVPAKFPDLSPERLQVLNDIVRTDRWTGYCPHLVR
uniref:uncharacterized protein n=1 Tax=Myxine glutinosa TaxID=7769 RepID=UPI00358E1E6C